MRARSHEREQVASVWLARGKILTYDSTTDGVLADKSAVSRALTGASIMSALCKCVANSGGQIIQIKAARGRAAVLTSGGRSDVSVQNWLHTARGDGLRRTVARIYDTVLEIYSPRVVQSDRNDSRIARLEFPRCWKARRRCRCAKNPKTWYFSVSPFRDFNRGCETLVRIRDGRTIIGCLSDRRSSASNGSSIENADV